MRELIIGLDLGTTALKIALFDKNGKIVAVSTQEYPLLTPQTDYVEVAPQTYWQSFKNGLDDLRKKTEFKPEEIKALGFSAQGETLFFLDKNGEPLRNAIVWMDTRAHDEAQEFKRKFSDSTCFSVTGQVSFEPCWPASKVLWIKNNEPEVFSKIDKILLIEDYFIYRMTGQFVAEGSLLTSTTYWNINTKEYWPEMLEYIGITREQLPDIRESGEVVGKLNEKIAEELGLSPETIICTGALDQAAGAIGVGNVREGGFSENIGAALAICVPVATPTFDPNRNMPLHYFIQKDMYMVHTFTTGGMALKWFRDVFSQAEKAIAELLDTDAYDLLSQEAAAVPPGCEGLLMLPHLTGSLAPDVNSQAKGVFYGFTLKHNRGHFVRSIFEAIGFIIRRNIEALADMGIHVTELRSLGGGSKSAVWNQIKADITGKTLITVDCDESACLGAAILAGKAIGLFTDIEKACNEMIHEKDRFVPNHENKMIYERGYNNYKKLFKDLESLFEVANKE
ncbi:MAG: FGGY-family carbohydrate kinase [Anaerolineae bacterium]|nr:FGGY-family carbohydrate kinase [Anaerolineae bacterium]